MTFFHDDIRQGKTLFLESLWELIGNSVHIRLKVLIKRSPNLPISRLVWVIEGHRCKGKTRPLVGPPVCGRAPSYWADSKIA